MKRLGRICGEVGRVHKRTKDFRSVETFPQVEPGTKTRDVAAKKAGLGSGKTYEKARAVVDGGTPEIIEAMDSGDLSISAA